MYKPKYFRLQELVPREIYENTPPERHGRLWKVFDERLLITEDRLRERFGRATINNWYNGGNLQYRGWRPFNCGIGSELSQHKFGRGADSNHADASPEEIREDIINNPDRKEYEFITCIEMDVTWLHKDIRNHDTQANGVLKVYP